MTDKRVLILLTNNHFSDPFLHSQLINIYKETEVFEKKILFTSFSESNVIEGIDLRSNFLGTFILKRIFLLYFSIINLLRVEKGVKITVHLRGGPMGILFFFIPKYWKKNVKYIYDPRGLFLDAKMENYPKFRRVISLFRFIEARIIKGAKFTIVESVKLKKTLISTYNDISNIIVCYNACSFESIDKEKMLIVNKKAVNIVYCGSVNYWHDIDEIVRVFNHINTIFDSENIKTNNFVYSQFKNHEIIREKFSSFSFPLKIEFIPYSQLEEQLNKMDIGVSVVKPSLSTEVTSPIKIADYIYKDLRIVCNSGIGDFDRYFIENESVSLYPYEGKIDISLESLLNLNYRSNKDLLNLFSIQYNKTVILDRILSD